MLKKTKQTRLKSERWVLRFFVVQGNYIRYYQNDEKQPRHLKGVVDLRDVTGVSLADSSSGIILIECPSGEIQLRPKDSEGRIAAQMGDLSSIGQMWVDAMQTIAS